LYKENVLFYDRETESLWSQLLSEGVTGPLAGTRLRVLPAENSTWGVWKATHPQTRALSFDTGYVRDYTLDPYATFPLARNPALLVSDGRVAKIYPFSELKKTRGPVVDRVGDQDVTVVYDRQSKTVQVKSEAGAITNFVSFLQDLKEFYPEAKVYKKPKQ
jgi:hypothetical protein